MSDGRGKRKNRGMGVESENGEKKRKIESGKKGQSDDDVVGMIEDDGRGQGEEREREEGVVMQNEKEEEEKKKRFECGICLELMNWEKEPRLLPCCGLSFCSPCLNKLFLLQNPSSSSSSSSSTSSSSSSFSLRGVKCPVYGKANECEMIETLELNYLIPETIDVLLSSSSWNPFSFSRSFSSQSEMLTCDTYDNGDDLEMKKRDCSNHPSETISGYCFQCSSFVCIRCVLETHEEHKEEVKSIEESVLKKRDEVVKIGDELGRRLIFIEEKRKRIEGEMKELEEKLEKKRIEKKEIELEKEDLRIRKDSIIRLSNTPTDVSLFFDDQLFSTLLQTANDIVSEGGVVGLRKPKKGVICCDGGGDSFRVISSFPFNEPLGVCVNSDGNIFICEWRGGLRVRDKEGNEMIESTIQKTIDSLYLEPVDVSIGLDDQIVVLDYSQDSFQVVILNKEGELIKSFGSKGSREGQFFNPWGVDVDEEGRIIVADAWNHRIQVFDNDGSFIHSFGSKGSSEGQFNKPMSVVVDGDGNIVVCDCLNHRIQVMDIEGNFIRCFGTEGSGDSQLALPSSVDVDGEGRIVVGELKNQRVSVFEKDGTFLFLFGKDHIQKPRGVVVASGTIIVSDCGKKSIEFWK